MQLSKDEIKTIGDYFLGSFSRKDASDKSDVDILVELDYSKHIGLGFINMKFDLEDKLHKKIDLVSTNAVSRYIVPFINNDKKLIYER
jgi:predicted nucleotidyltransferase